VAWEEWDYVIKVLELLKRHDLKQEHSTYRASLKTCWEFANADAALDILTAMHNNNRNQATNNVPPPKPTDVGLVVSTLCKSRRRNNNNNNGNNRPTTTQWQSGWKLLQAAATIPSTSIDNMDASHYAKVVPIKAYQDVLGNLKREGRWKESVRLLRWMETGAKPSDEAKLEEKPASTTESASSDDLLSKPYGFFIPSPTLSTYQSVIECCLDNQQSDTAVQLLCDMVKTRDLQPKPSTFHLVLSALAKQRQWRTALQLLDFMIENNVPRSVVTYNTVISACAKAREVGMAKNLLHRMKQQDNIRPDEISYNAVIGACANTARWKEALEVLDQCYREPGVTPNIFIYTNAMR
jgi:pentatricopeptide repeat protein